MEKRPGPPFQGNRTRSLAPPAAPTRIEEEPAPPPPPGCPHLAGGGRVGFGRSRRSGSARTPGCALVARAAAWSGLRGWRGARAAASGDPGTGRRERVGRTAEAEAEKRRGGEQGRRRGERRTREGRRAAGPGAPHGACAERGTLPHSGPRALSSGCREQASLIQVSRWGNRGRCRGHTRDGSGHLID